MVDVAVTGATGRVGGRVAARLAEAGIAPRLIVRNPARLPDSLRADALVAEYADGDACVRAMRGARTVFMVSAAESPDRLAQHKAFIDAAVAAGVEHLVYLSFFGAAPDSVFLLARDHWHTEQYIRRSGLQWTFLRDNLYADLVPFFVDHGELRNPSGDGRAALVAIDDVADVAASVLQRPGDHRGRTYSLTGPQPLSMWEIAATFTDVSGQATRYVPETEDEAYASRAKYDAPAWMVDGWVSSYLAIAAGQMDGVTDAVARLTGHAATPLAEVLAADSGTKSAG